MKIKWPLNVLPIQFWIYSTHTECFKVIIDRSLVHDSYLNLNYRSGNLNTVFVYLIFTDIALVELVEFQFQGGVSMGKMGKKRGKGIP